MTPGDFAAWGKVAPEFRAAAGGTAHRDWPGWGGLRYTNATGRNDIVAARVACDTRNIYFYARTQATLTPRTGANWMRLLVDADQDPKTGWHGYDFLVNGRARDGHTTTLTRLSDGRTWPVAYRAAGDELMVAVPRALLGLTGLRRTALDFHWVDDVKVGPGGEDPSGWWYDGDSAPDGRFNFRYVNDGKGR